MFKNDASGKAIFTMWLQFQNILLTSDRLLIWGMDVGKTCVFCHGHDESRDHLFVECSFIINVQRHVTDVAKGSTIKNNDMTTKLNLGNEECKIQDSRCKDFQNGLCMLETIYGV